MLCVRRSTRRSRRLLPGALVLALVAVLCTVWTGGAALASPSASELQSQLRRLNADADQAVEQYLEAQLELKQTRASLDGMQRQVDAAGRQVGALRELVSARAASAYMFGPADVALVLSPGKVDDTLDRIQTLNLLAQRANDQLNDLGVAERALQTEMARLTKVERELQAQVKRLAAQKDKVDRLVSRTRGMLAQLRARAGAAGLNRVDPGLPSGSLPPPPTGSSGAAAAVRYAYAQLGKPYQYGAAGPGAFDCSGLTMMAWRQGGIALPHSAAGQIGIGRRVSQSELQPGDLIYRYSPISHVAIYVGGGMQIAATHTGSVVKVQAAVDGNVVGFSRPNG